MVRDSLLNKEVRRKDLGQSSRSVALVTNKNDTRGHNQDRDHCRYDKHDISKGRSKSRNKNSIMCYRRQNPGYMKKNYHLWKREQSKEKCNSQKSQHETTTTSIDDDGSINLACQLST